ncbi:hypothetical protein H8F24_06905 [Synechococcus sp. CBW1002]|nr:hypothetical protein [Synechococcus sp. CBW1006]QPN61030.1 hypothetical protein H8F24_06905 [Synechococcus sp. CBW1002]QPN67248.1 hypothetical protein H8F26_03130 [Synechococcus sp. CBW1006]
MTAALPRIVTKYSAIIDADEYLHPGTVKLLLSHDIQTLSMPWALTATLDFSRVESHKKQFILFPRGKEIVRVADVQEVKPHTSTMSRLGSRITLKQGKSLPLRHYYCRGVEDLLVKFSLSGGTYSRLYGLSQKSEQVIESIRTGRIWEEFGSHQPSGTLTRIAATALVLALMQGTTVIDDFPLPKVNTALSTLLLSRLGITEADTEIAVKAVDQLKDIFYSDTLLVFRSMFHEYFADSCDGVNLQAMALALVRQGDSRLRILSRAS